MGMKAAGGSVRIERHIDAPADRVARYIGDFRNAREWMVGVEAVERLDGERYRLYLETPVGRMEPEAKITERGEDRIRWIYTSVVDGGGEVVVRPDGERGCVVSYSGYFRLRRGLLDRAARLVGAERFARRNGERSLERLKALMEARG
ncbi:MAG: SRPBCC family protein [Rubrobacteraceae bacterium]|nr:SRPBCC family protein [Rubrobacteraceae bacterium]